MRSDRLEPVWRSALAVAGLFASVFTVLFVSLIPGMSTEVFYLVAGAGVTACAVGLAWCVQRVVEGDSWSALGLNVSRGSAVRMLRGAAAGFAVVVVADVVCVLSGAAEWDPDASLANVPAWLTVIIPSVLLVQAVPEELWFRGYLFRHLRLSLPLGATVVITSVLFGALHLISSGATGSAAEKPFHVLQAVAFGFALAACRIVTGELWLAIGFHAGYGVLNERLITAGEGLAAVELFCLAATLAAAGVLFLRRRHRRTPLDWRARPAASMEPAPAEERPLAHSGI
ncbi:CPBP family intramembrane glutamic endopeptidase [Planomonospora corallina]|uniref:CPBP family intramembrane glutamic endopeptidase n=1 Tax=Planomonospora corallina TaxID=1806052 RepID=A0ABV8I760_9ACTN